MSLGGTIRLARDRSTDGSASGRGVPNYLAGIRIDPDGARAWVVGKKDNTTRGTFFSPAMVPGQDSTVRAMLALIDLQANQEDASLRLDIDNSDSPSAIAFSPRGDYAFLALQGNNQIAVVDVLDLLRQDSPGTVHSRWSTGLAPQGVAIDETTGAVVSSNFLGRSVTVFDAEAFLDSGSLSVPSATVDTVGVELLDAEVLRGKRIFYDASDPRMSAEGYMSCATCHIDGGHDGRTWDFTSRGEGFRNTVDLRGRSGTGHGNVHWSANFDEIQDFENDIRGFFGGSGFLGDADFATASDPLGATKAGLDDDLDALAAYVASLAAESLPRSPAGTRTARRAPRPIAAPRSLPPRDARRATFRPPITRIARCTTSGRCGLPPARGSAVRSPASKPRRCSARMPERLTSTTEAPGRWRTSSRRPAAAWLRPRKEISAAAATWFPMKEWHQGAYVEISGGQTITFDDVETTLAGGGYIEIRYAVQYGTANLRIVVNGGAPTIVPLAVTPNSPNFVPTEWRTLRVPVTYASGANTIVLSRSSGGVLAIDDVLFSTPDDAAAASAHVRDLEPDDIADLVAYVASLDAHDATLPAGECGGDGQPECGSVLVVSKANLTLGSANRPDGGQLKIGAELLEELSAEDLLADFAAGLEVRVRDADSSFDVTLTIPGCGMKGDGRSIRCGSNQDGAQALLRPRDGVWRLTLKARGLPATVTGADDVAANPVHGPASVLLVRGGVVHLGTASDCRERPPRKLACRN